MYEILHNNYPKLLGSWIANDILGYLNRNKLDSTALKIAPEKLSQLAKAVSDSQINELTGKSILIQSLTSNQDIDVLLASEVGKSVDNEQLLKIIDDIFLRNPQAVRDAKTDPNAIHFLIGKVMKETKGHADHVISKELIEKKLSE